MKIIALLLLLLGALLILGVGALSILMFAMAFDAPGSGEKPGVWLFNVLIFLPLLLLVAVLIYAFMAYLSGNYTRSVWLGSVFVVVGVVCVTYFEISSIATLREYRASQAQAVEEARLHPVQQFVRPFEGGADTIIVFPNHIVAYRMPMRGDMPFAYSGPVGDLNESRDAIVIDPVFDRRIGLDEFPEFVDEQGRKLTEVYVIR